MSRRAKLRRGVRLRNDRRRGIMLLLAPDRGLSLSPTAAAVLELCDGRHDTGAIARTLSERFSAPAGAIERDVEATLRTLTAAGYLDWGEA